MTAQMETKNRFKIFRTLALVGIMAAGCGGSEYIPLDYTNVQSPHLSPSASCTKDPSSKTINGQCVYASTFEEACHWVGGKNVSGSNGPLCQVEYHYYAGSVVYNPSFSYSQSYSLLNFDDGYYHHLGPSNPVGSNPVHVGFQLKANDIVRFQGSASWGYNNGVSGALGDCDGSVSGNSYPEGLYVSDGKKAYFIGTNGSAVIENAASSVRMGFNMSSDGECGNIDLGKLIQIRCVDQNDNVQVCPQ